MKRFKWLKISFYISIVFLILNVISYSYFSCQIHINDPGPNAEGIDYFTSVGYALEQAIVCYLVLPILSLLFLFATFKTNLVEHKIPTYTILSLNISALSLFVAPNCLTIIR